MSELNRKNHWENIYATKQLNEVSWYQPTPATSLDFIEKLSVAKDAAIIDVGGGDGFLVDHLLKLGYTKLTVLDISKKAIERAQKRLGKEAEKVTWMVSDVNDFKPTQKYDVWHDRAAFHFLNHPEEIKHYVNLVQDNLSKNGHLVMGTFSKNGPLKCSGIEITQYNPEDLKSVFLGLTLMEQQTIEHLTPFDTVQNFTFCWFKK